MRIGTRLFAKNNRKGCALSTSKQNKAKAQKSAIRHFQSVDWHSKSAEWYSWVLISLSCLGAFWTPFLGFLELDLALRRVFNPYSKTFISFLNNPSLFRNNYLVNKYPKINFDKFRLSTILLLSNYPFYSYASNPILDTNCQPITKLFN